MRPRSPARTPQRWPSHAADPDPTAPARDPHLDIAAAYRPAGSGSEVGGDFYDVLPGQGPMRGSSSSATSAARGSRPPSSRRSSGTPSGRSPSSTPTRLTCCTTSTRRSKPAAPTASAPWSQSVSSGSGRRWELALSVAGHPPALRPRTAPYAAGCARHAGRTRGRPGVPAPSGTTSRR